MRNKAGLVLILAALAVLAGPAGAQPAVEAGAEETGDPLSVEALLASSARHAPRILEQMAQARSARADVLAAQGAFDTELSSEGYARATGVWNGRFIDNQIKKPLAPFGAEVYGGYRISDGGEFGPLGRSFPIYEDIFHTNQAGEVKFGFRMSLLRDRVIDDRRFDLAQSRLSFDLAEINVLIAQIAVQHRALRAYRNWVAAGAQVQVYQDLLEIGLEREQALIRRVREGDAAEILITENRQNLLRRQTLVVEAERQLAAAAFALSMFWRNDQGRPLVPPRVRLPDDFGTLRPPPYASDEAMIAAGQARRPELALIDTNIEKARNRLFLAENELKPRLDFNFEVSRDLGAVGPGGSTFDSTDTVLSFLFQVPIERRFAKGRISSAQAEMKALRFRRQRTEEQIAIEIRTLVVDLEAAREMVELARAEQQQAATMQRVERTRFEAGLSDFFLLNMREERLADARVRRVEAQLRYFLALADLYAAVMDLEALGLGR